MIQQDIIIDATKQKLGRVASEVAKSLRGKTTADFLPSRTTFPRVVVKNIDSLDLNVRRLKKESYSRYSGYPGGRHETSMMEVAEKDKCELFKRTVWGMLPKNKLRSQMIKNLILNHGDTK